MRDSDGELSFNPRLPAEWERLRFRVRIRGQLIEVDMTPGTTTYRLLEGAGIVLRHRDEAFRLLAGAPFCWPAEPRELPRAA